MTTADVHRFFERESVSRTASTSSGSRAPEGSGRSTGTRDGKTGGAVALKLLHAGQCLARSHRDTRILAKLRHPAVVRYVASGVAPARRYAVFRDGDSRWALRELRCYQRAAVPFDAWIFDFPVLEIEGRGA